MRVAKRFAKEDSTGYAPLPPQTTSGEQQLALQHLAPENVIVSENNKRPSMDDFDYFDDSTKPVGWDNLDEANIDGSEGLDAQLNHYRNRQKRYTRSLTLMIITLAVSIWAIWGYQETISYAFADNHGPREFGDAVNVLPDQIPHNSYVHLRGITEHRGTTQSRFGHASLKTQEYWYFRLVGSRGVFIETPNDPDLFGITRHIDVEGRVIDPALDDSYATLLNHYHSSYGAKRRSDLRVIQVGVIPGEGKPIFIAAFAFLAMLLLSNLVVLRKLLVVRRQLKGGAITPA